MMNQLPCLSVTFHPDTPSADLAGASVLLQVSECFDAETWSAEGVSTKGGKSPAWMIGRYRDYVDFWIKDGSKQTSGIHCTIYYDRSLNQWMLIDGGVYLEPVVSRSGQVVKNKGYSPSSMGVFINTYRLKPRNPEPITPGDRVFLKPHVKLIVSKNLESTVGTELWRGDWGDEAEEDKLDTQLEINLAEQVSTTADSVQQATSMASVYSQGIQAIEKASPWRFLVLILALLLLGAWAIWLLLN